MPKLFIKNRKGQRMAVIVEEASPQKGLAFVMPGLRSYKQWAMLELVTHS